MELRLVPLELSRIDALRYEVLVLPHFSDERPLRGAAGLCDWRLCGRLSSVIVRGHVTGDEGEVTLVPGRPRLPFEKLLLFGAGPSEGFDQARATALVGRVLRVLDGLRLRTMATALPGRGGGGVGPVDAMRWFLAALPDPVELDEVAVLDDLEAQRAMIPVVEGERRRMRVLRDAREGV